MGRRISADRSRNEEDNGWIITPFVESKGYSEKRKAPYSIELDEISSSKILLLWKPQKMPEIERD